MTPFPNPATQFKKGDAVVTNREYKRKGGLTPTPKKAISACIRYMREHGYNEATANKLFNILENREIAAIDALIYIRRLLGLAGNDTVALNMGISRFLDWFKAVHGQKIDITNHQAQWDELFASLGVKVIDVTPKEDNDEQETTS